MTKFIDTRNWTFIKDGVDDFRSGLPSCGGDVLVKGNTNLQPILTNVKSKKSNERSSEQHKSDIRGNTHRATLIQQQRHKNVEAVEKILIQHPLALYPHLEECLPPELFEDVVNILDPEMSVASDGENSYQDNGQLIGDQPAVYAVEGKKDEAVENETADNAEVKLQNPYRWLTEGDENYKKDKMAIADQQKSSASEDDEEHIKHVTQDFCEWVSSLGGDSNNIDESTVTSLFASGYETKPALSVPIHVVELANVPQELRMAAAPAPQSTGSKSTTQIDKSAASTSRNMKYKYGAWYLEPNLWKKQPVDEPLRDPNDTKDQEISEAKQKSLKLDHELATMSGVMLFMDFIDKKETRRPEFLDHIADIHAQQQNEELVHQEANLVKPKSKLITRSKTMTN